MSDVLILGGGVIGLSLAIELTLRGAVVRVLDGGRAGMASTAAAGMLAPQAEGLPPGPLRDFALTSRERWSSWSQRLEDLTQESVGYWLCGILAPRPTLQAWSRSQLLTILPDLDPVFQGAAWFPQEGQVDPRAVFKVLRCACQQLKIPVMQPVQIQRLAVQDGAIQRVITSTGDWTAYQYVLCTGSWSADLLGVPVYPVKGQLLSRAMPHGRLEHIIFGPGIYLVPRRDGRLVVGATEETVGFSPGTTSQGMALLNARLAQLLPEALDWPLLETWFGYRPCTPDHAPLLGPGPYTNLWLATGHHRNGILFSPQTAHVLADSLMGVAGESLIPFSYQRFDSQWSRYDEKHRQ